MSTSVYLKIISKLHILLSYSTDSLHRSTKNTSAELICIVVISRAKHIRLVTWCFGGLVILLFGVSSACNGSNSSLQSLLPLIGKYCFLFGSYRLCLRSGEPTKLLIIQFLCQMFQWKELFSFIGDIQNVKVGSVVCKLFMLTLNASGWIWAMPLGVQTSISG